MNKLTDSSSNNESNNGSMWKEFKQKLDNGASINVNKLKICDYFYDILMTRVEKDKKISKEDNETEVLSKSQTAEEVQKIVDNLEEYYDVKEEEERKMK
jgi:hypothetical protein